MTRGDILEQARRAVTTDRAVTHGPAEDTFGAIARVWSARLGFDLRPDQVAVMLIDLKTCRAWGNPGHADNWVDMAGYAACGGELSERPVDTPTGPLGPFGQAVGIPGGIEGEN